MDWIIDQNYIASLPSHSPLELPMGSRVTEAAKEKAREKNILIRFIPGVLEPKKQVIYHPS
jgi:hypothetical protein